MRENTRFFIEKVFKNISEVMIIYAKMSQQTTAVSLHLKVLVLHYLYNNVLKPITLKKLCYNLPFSQMDVQTYITQREIIRMHIH